MFYYVVKTDRVPDINQTKLTKQEKNYKFDLKFVPYNSFEEYVRGFLNNKQKVNCLIASEILSAFNELSKLKMINNGDVKYGNN